MVDVREIKKMYPSGTKIRLTRMGEDQQRVPDGTIGTVRYVDDIGTIHMRWETGSSLGLIVGEDEFEKIS